MTRRPSAVIPLALSDSGGARPLLGRRAFVRPGRICGTRDLQRWEGGRDGNATRRALAASGKPAARQFEKPTAAAEEPLEQEVVAVVVALERAVEAQLARAYSGNGKRLSPNCSTARFLLRKSCRHRGGSP